MCLYVTPKNRRGFNDGYVGLSVAKPTLLREAARGVLRLSAGVMPSQHNSESRVRQSFYSCVCENTERNSLKKAAVECFFSSFLSLTLSLSLSLSLLSLVLSLCSPSHLKVFHLRGLQVKPFQMDLFTQETKKKNKTERVMGNIAKKSSEKREKKKQRARIGIERLAIASAGTWGVCVCVRM